MIKTSLPPLSIVLLLATAAAAQRRVWIVDQNGGPGVDFTAIHLAVAAASPGDWIEVRGAGPHTGFTLDKGAGDAAAVEQVPIPGEADRICLDCHVQKQARFHWR